MKPKSVKPRRDGVTTWIRMPLPLREYFSEQAKANFRTLNAEIVRALHMAQAADKAKAA